MTALNPTRKAWTRPLNPWSCPGGVGVASNQIARDAWLGLRRDMVCASDVAAIAGASVWGDPLTVWLDKTGRAAPDDTTDAQMRGLIFEEPIIQLWAERYAEFPIEFRRQGLMRSRTDEHAGATVDRLSICPLGRCLTEVKSQVDVRKWTDELGGEEVPVEYQFQGQWQLYITGRDHIHFVVLGPRFQPLHRLMYRDEPLIKELAAVMPKWWAEHVIADVMPAATHIALDAAKRMMIPAAGAVCEIDADLAVHVQTAKLARDAIAEAEKVRDTALANIYATMGSATSLVWPEDGTVELTWNPGKAIDGANAAWKKAHPELVEAFSVPGPDVLNTAKLVEQHPELIDNGELRYRRTTSWK